ncbi:MAG: hypothetical protein U5K43_01800 [Halofilum sp. (in: g-proteobacteria)]|nr:hypothetical protein [Halofilum sp. (in: g-proteobacteria)]
MILVLGLAGCGGGSGGGSADDGDDSTTDGGSGDVTASFSSASAQAGSDPKLLRLSWTFTGTADHFVVEVNPDGASGYTQADVDGDGTVNGDDEVAAGASSVQLSLPVHLADFDNALYRIVARDAGGTELASSTDIGLLGVAVEDMIGYFKASNTDPGDDFGFSVAVSGDGDTMAVGARDEDSAATGVGDAQDNDSSRSGAVYVFVRDASGAWSQQAYVKASNTDDTDFFGNSVALSADGNVLAVGAPSEDGGNGGVDVDGSDNSLDGAGAAYVFTRDGAGSWTEQAYVKAEAPASGARFGSDVALADDGQTLAVSAPFRDNDTGAAYVFTAAPWSQQAVVRGDNSSFGDRFGSSLALAGDAGTLAVGAAVEDGSGTGVNAGDNDDAVDSGAAYVFTPDGAGAWSQQAYVKASNTDPGDQFGAGVALSGSGDTLVVGATLEQSTATGIDGNQDDNSLTGAGAAYVFARDGTGKWLQQAYVKASNTGEDDVFGRSPALSADGDTLVVSAHGEAGDAVAIGGNDSSDGAGEGAGAVYVFVEDGGGTWAQAAYVKPPSTPAGENFGFGLSLAADAETLAIGARGEPSAATGIGGDQTDISASGAGAVYLY